MRSADEPLWEHIRTWRKGPYRLELYECPRTWAADRWGRSHLAYLFFREGRLVFSGDDYGPSPMHAFDSDASVGGLLAFLALKPGDTDDEYFKSYTPAQLEWCQAHGEELSLLAYELENPTEEKADA